MIVKRMRVRPSGAGRWVKCTASPAMELGEWEEQTVFAQDGVLAHTIFENLMLEQDNALDLFDNVDEVTQCNATRMAKLTAEYCKTFTQLDQMWEVEKSVDVSEWTANPQKQVGKIDFVAIRQEPNIGNIVTIVDMKCGAGVKVSAKENDQLILYTLGMRKVLIELGFPIPRFYNLTIFQPPFDHEETVVFLDDELVAEGERIKKHAVEVRGTGTKTFFPDISICRFCAAKPVCAALARACFRAIIGDRVMELIPADVEKLDNMTLARILQSSDMIINYVKSVEPHILSAMKRGQKFVGVSLVNGKGNRKWDDAEGVKEFLEPLLGEATFAPRKMISPKQAEDILGKGKLASLYTKYPGALKPVCNAKVQQIFQEFE